MIPQPLFVLAPPHGQSARVAAMLGAHPQACFVPELNLSLAANVGELLSVFHLAEASGLEDGLMRTVAQLFCGGQTREGVETARRWLERRVDRPTEDLLWEIAERLAPRQLVVPDTSAIWRPDLLRRLARQFPDARWLHVLRHPRLYCVKVLAALNDRLFVAEDYLDHFDRFDPPIIDPQLAWYRVHLNMDRAQTLRADAALTRHVRAEALLAAPELHLAELAGWQGWDTGPAAVEAMLAPELSPYAGYGPTGAIEGMDPEFMEHPVYERGLRPLTSLEGPLEWRKDRAGFSPEIWAMAQAYGYA